MPVYDPSIPGVPNPPGSNLPQNTSGTGLPDYKDIPVNPVPSPVVPGTPEWYQQELGGLYNQKIFIGVGPERVQHGPVGEHGGGGATHYAGENMYTNTQRIYKQYLQLSQTNKDAFMLVQDELYDAGAYGSTPRANVHWGQLTDETRQALIKKLGDYVSASATAEMPITFSEFLANEALQGRKNQAQGGVGGAGPGKAPPPTPVIQLQDPASLRQSAEQAAQAALGHGFAPDELEKFVSEFQARQRDAQLASQTATGPNPVSVTEPDMVAEANQFAQEQNPQGYSNHQAQGYMNAFLNMFLPQGSQRPNIQPVPYAQGG